MKTTLLCCAVRGIVENAFVHMSYTIVLRSRNVVWICMLMYVFETRIDWRWVCGVSRSSMCMAADHIAMRHLVSISKLVDRLQEPSGCDQ